MSKKVIFVGGTARSGSTMLDMILSNDPLGYSLGEINAIFRPYRKHHFREIKKLRSDNIWSNILKRGERNLYDNLFIIFNNINYFVDSSKDILWINKQLQYLLKKNIDTKNILIYKTPQELAVSFAKRGRLDKLEYGIESYYKKYLYYVHDFRSIAYKQLIQEPDALKKLCDYLGIQYFPDKLKYWEKVHHSFFGSDSVMNQKNLYYIKPDNQELIKIGNKIEEKYKDIFEYIYSKNILLEQKDMKYHTTKTYIRKKLIYTKTKYLSNKFKAQIEYLIDK